MQDLSDGQLKPLIGDFITKSDKNSFEELKEELYKDELKEKLQKAKDEVQPDRTKQGPVYYVGQNVICEGGRFRISSIGKNKLVLKGIKG